MTQFGRICEELNIVLETTSIATAKANVERGTGSLSEIFACLEEYRTLDSNKRLILYNDDGFYDDLISSIGKLIELGFNDKSILEKIEIVNTIDELKERMK